MARSHVPKPTRTDSSDLGHNPQHDIRSALESPPRAFHSQFDDAPIEVNREFEYEDGTLTRAWDQVRFGRARSNGIDLRTRKSFSFRRIGNHGRSVGGRNMVTYLHACTKAATPPRLIQMRYVTLCGKIGPRINFNTDKKSVQLPYIISSICMPRC